MKFLGTYVTIHVLPHNFRKGLSSKLGKQQQRRVTKFNVLICKRQLESENQKLQLTSEIIYLHDRDTREKNLPNGSPCLSLEYYSEEK